MRSSRTTRRAGTPSSSATWSSRPRGRRTPPTSSRRSTSAERWARRSGSPRCASSAGASSTRSRAGAASTGTSPPTRTRRIFAEELTHLVVTQKAAFNSPVWFNVGVPDTPQQCSACFILAVDDHMSSILNWYVEEGTIFKGGSGSGINLSRIRSSKETSRGRRHGQRPGQLHARRRRLGRHHQVRRQDAARGQDGDPERRPPRRRGLHLVQGQRRAEGPRVARRRLRHGPRRQGQRLDPVSERQQLGPRHRRLHAGLRAGSGLEAQGRHHGRDRGHHPRARPDAPDRRRGMAVRRPGHAVRHDDQRVAHVPGDAAGSTARTPAASTCTWTTARATSPR